MEAGQAQQEATTAAPPAAAAAAPPDAAVAADTADPSVPLPELPLFSCKEAYVYRVPPATTVGHRAELWDVNNWLATVSLKVVQADDDAYVRLMDDKTGELFAECPVPIDKPLVTAVEPVIDSSRYFVLRIVDRDSQRHAFIGIGFRDRSESSDFNAALHEYLQYIKRKRTAEAMRHAYEERLQSGDGEAVGGEGQGAGPLPAADYSIKEGETLTLKINLPAGAGARAASSGGGGGGGFVSGAAARTSRLGKTFSLMMDGKGGAIAALSPPPGSSPKLQMSVSPCPSASDGGGSPLSSAGSGGSPSVAVSGGSVTAPFGRAPHARLSGAGEVASDLRQKLQGLELQEESAARTAAGSAGAEGGMSGSASATSSMTAAAATEDDDFGDFEAAELGGGAEAPVPAK